MRRLGRKDRIIWESDDAGKQRIGPFNTHEEAANLANAIVNEIYERWDKEDQEDHPN